MVDPLEVGLLVVEFALERALEIGARPIVNGVRVILVIVLVDGNEAGELVGSLLIRIRLGVLLGVAVIGFPNGGTFREMSVDEIFETVADGGVCAAGVLVEVEVDAFGQFTVVVCNLQLRHDALIGVDLKLIVVGHAARDLRNEAVQSRRAIVSILPRR